MKKITPKTSEIENIAAEIRAKLFPRLMIFSDVVNRYVEITMKDKINWLRTRALVVLITRGGSLTPSQLARIMLRSNHSMTRLIDSLEKDGLVRRLRLGKDRRTIHVKVTSAGLAIMMQTLNDIAVNEQEINSCLDKNESQTLAALIRKLRDHLVERITNR